MISERIDDGREQFYGVRCEKETSKSRGRAIQMIIPEQIPAIFKQKIW
jgi:hypothetical protein